MKRKLMVLVAGVCACALCFALAGCSSEEKKDQDVSSAETEAVLDMDISADDEAGTYFDEGADKKADLDIVIVDDDLCTIKVTAEVAGSFGTPGYRFIATNNSEQHLESRLPNGAFSVDGKVIEDVYGGFTLSPGKSAEFDIYLDEEDLYDTDTLTNVKGVIEIRDAESRDTITEYELAL